MSRSASAEVTARPGVEFGRRMKLTRTLVSATKRPLPFIEKFVELFVGEAAPLRLGADLLNQREQLSHLAAMAGVYLVLGCFVETLTLMVATTPIIVPIVKQLGYSPIWFGVVFVILIELALITPPIGMNLFVVQSVRGGGRFKEVALGAMPFAAIMLVMIGLLMMFPQLALWLPQVYADATR